MLVFIIGLLSGVISGMGIGGGTILIPSLIFIVGAKQQIAQSVNLISFIPTALAALYIHFKHKNIETRIVLKLIIIGSIGSVAGSLLAVSLNSEILKKAFGLFLLGMGIYEILSKKNIKGKAKK